MGFLCNKLVREIQVPTGKICCFDYSDKLNLIASFGEEDLQATIWDPDTGKIVNRITMRHSLRLEYHDILFLPERCVGVCGMVSDTEHGVAIYSIDSGQRVLNVVTGTVTGHEIDDEFCCTAVLTYHNKLVTGSGFEFEIDFKTREILSKRVIFSSGDGVVFHMCCSNREKSGYKVYYSLERSGSLEITCITVFDEARDMNVRPDMTNSYKISCTDYTLSLDHDGENLIYANDQYILALEEPHGQSKDLVTNWIPETGMIQHGRHWLPDFGYMDQSTVKCNKKCELMVSPGNDVIKVYKYKVALNLLELCRQCINNILNDRIDNVESLPISNVMKKYLLYET